MSRNKKKAINGGWLVIFLGLVLVWSLSKGLWEVREGYRRVEEAEKVLRQEKEKKESLEEEYERVQDDEYIERVVRDELNMQKSGETVVVLPDNEILKLEDSLNEENKAEKNWVKWWNLIN